VFFINGLTAGIDDCTEVGGSDFSFMLSADGSSVSTEEGNPAICAGNVLKLSPIKVIITPGIDPSSNASYEGIYQLSCDYIYASTHKGVAITYLLPSLVYWIATNNDATLRAPFTLTVGTSATCVSGGIPYSFTVPINGK
jgi:hypothetical protein